MDVKDVLGNEKDRNMLVEKLEGYMRKYGFSERINRFTDDVIGGGDTIDIDVVFDKVYNFVAANLPPEIQEAFYHDVRDFIDKRVVVEE